MRFLSRKGIALVAAVMFMVFATIAVLGIVTFIAQRLSQQPAEEAFLKAIYLAQAGLHYAIYQYRSTGTPYSGTASNIDGSGGYAVVVSSGAGGGQASSLVINATASSIGGTGNRDLLGVTLSNSGASTITIDRMNVTWSCTSKTMQQILISGSTFWSGRASSPANVNIWNASFAPGQTRPLTRIRWNSSMNSCIITLQCVMTDGSTTNACTVFPRPASTCTTSGSITINSMGKTAGSNVYRTIRAVYNTATGTIASSTETNATVP